MKNRKKLTNDKKMENFDRKYNLKLFPSIYYGSET